MAFQQRLRNALQPRPNGNMEFSWKIARYNGLDILPEVRLQEADTCVFDAFCAGGEMAVKRDAASKGRSCDIGLNTSSLVTDYESHTGRRISEESPVDIPYDTREKTLSRLFRDNGAPATSAEWEGEQRIRFTRVLNPRSPHFDRIAHFILQGRPMVGCMPVDSRFHKLGPEDIYEYFDISKSDEKIDNTHYVLFVGFGHEAGFGGDPYLIFLNSHGLEFGDSGFGRVYFKDVFKNSFYVFPDEAPLVPNSGASTSSARATNTAAALSGEEPDRPRQRRRVEADDGGSSSLPGHCTLSASTSTTDMAAAPPRSEEPDRPRQRRRVGSRK